MKKRLVLGVTVVAILVAGIATYSWAAASADVQTINACVNGEGGVRLVVVAGACRRGEHAVNWNTVGPVGPQGPVGAAGPAGRDGVSAANPPEPDLVAGTLTVTSQQQGASFGPIDVTGLTHEITSPRDPASGLPTGKRQHQPITITKQMDQTSPLLLNDLTNNASLSSVLIGLSKDGKQVATIKLTNASVSHYVTHGLTELWSFTYQKITWTWLDGNVTASDDWEAPVA
jgi:type VI secretion system secreted protein Hcp